MSQQIIPPSSTRRPARLHTIQSDTTVTITNQELVASPTDFSNTHSLAGDDCHPNEGFNMGDTMFSLGAEPSMGSLGSGYEFAPLPLANPRGHTVLAGPAGSVGPRPMTSHGQESTSNQTYSSMDMDLRPVRRRFGSLASTRNIRSESAPPSIGSEPTIQVPQGVAGDAQNAPEAFESDSMQYGDLDAAGSRVQDLVSAFGTLDMNQEDA